MPYRGDRLTIGVLALVATFAGAAPAHATLIVLGDGLIYDTEQDLTWLQDPMLARTSGHDSDGRMTYDSAVAWAHSLEYGGFDDWRLPQVYGTGWWWDSDSEISRMVAQIGWHWGITSPHSTIPDYIQGGTGPFVNFPQNTFWLGANLWWSAFYSTDGADSDVSRAWAVRVGGSPEARVPEPSTLGLVALGLGAAALKRRRRASRAIGAGS